jgi:O-antigen/teichoic acid export membrane protein
MRRRDLGISSKPANPIRWTLLGRVGGVAAFGITTLLLSSSLNSTGLAHYLVLQALAAFASGLSSAGENKTAMLILAGSDPIDRPRLELGWRPVRRHRVVRAAVLTAVLCHLVMWVVQWAGSIGSSELQLVFASLTACLLGWQMIAVDALRAVGDVRAANLGTGRNGGFVTQAALAMGLVGFRLAGYDLTLSIAMSITTAASALGLAHLVVAYRRAAGMPIAAGTAPAVLTPATTGSPVAVVAAQLLSSAVVQLDLIIAGAFFANGAVAAYGIARRLATLLAFPLQTGTLAVSPDIVVGLRGQDHGDLERRLGRMAAFATGITLCGAILAALLPTTVWRAAGISNASDVKSLFLLLAVGQVVNTWTGACGTVLVLSNHQRVLVKHGLFTAIGLILVLIVVGSRHRVFLFALFGSVVTAMRFLTLLIATHRRTGIWTHPTRKCLAR